jgi:hypothetical protein
MGEIDGPIYNPDANRRAPAARIHQPREIDERERIAAGDLVGAPRADGHPTQRVPAEHAIPTHGPVRRTGRACKERESADGNRLHGLCCRGGEVYENTRTVQNEHADTNARIDST